MSREMVLELGKHLERKPVADEFKTAAFPGRLIHPPSLSSTV